jgi:hypothetical protein
MRESDVAHAADLAYNPAATAAKNQTGALAIEWQQ